MRSFNRRYLILVASLVGSAAVLVNCGDDDDTPPTQTAGTGGTGGASGSGGKGGSAGTTTTSGGAAGTTTGGPDGGGTAGKAGAGGSGGAAGKGGAGGGGTAGTAGKAGSGGTGGMTDGGSDGDASPLPANVRVAHLSPGAPAVDFCLAVHGTTTFTGPVLAANGVTTGLAYGNVTKYLPVAAAQYDVRIVAVGAPNCATPLAGLADTTNLPALPPGASATIAAEGEVSPGDAALAQPFGLKAYIDDTTVATGKAKLRLVHASSGTPAVDVGLGGGVLFTPVFTNVAFGNTATATNGYVETAPLTNAEISARATGTTSDVLAIKGATLAAGNIATAFAIGKIGNVATPLKVLLCVDNGTPVGALTPCVILGDTPARAHVRVAHLSPDAPAVDVCLTPTGTPFSGGPILKSLGGATGLAYSQITTYVDLPVAAYDVRLVAANAADCVNRVVPDTLNVVVTDALYATIGALGVVSLPDGGAADAGTDPAFGLKVFVDNRAPSATSTNILLRFIHASPGTPTVDVGLGSGTGFAKVFGPVTYSNFGVGVGIDLKGYVDTAAFSNTTISARATGTTADALIVPNVTIAAGNYATVFAIGNKTGDVTKPLKALLCVDSAPAVGLLTSCTVAP